MQWDQVWMEKETEERLPRQGRVSGPFLQFSGSLSNNDGDSFENVTAKVTLRCFKLHRAYSISFNSSNVGNFFWSWYRSSEKESRVLTSMSFTKHKNRHFHVVVVQKCTTKRDARAKLLFCQSKPIAFLPGRSRLRRRRRCLISLLCILETPRIYRGVEL